jgi:chromosome condensin MukBEF ATPase and DNA-binding subunit MukB
MDLIHKMGTRSDMQARAKTPRRDNLHRQKLVNRARYLIYENNKAVGNTEVESLLRPTSLVPTEVCLSSLLQGSRFDY